MGRLLKFSSSRFAEFSGGYAHSRNLDGSGVRVHHAEALE
jgi:hypothetical protein